MDFWKNIADFGPREAAEQLVQADAADEVWLDTFLEYLDRRRGGLQPSTSSPFCSTRFNSFNDGPSGLFWPCSHFCTVDVLVFR